MNGLEAAIKNALARSDRSSAEVRARIYQSSREALEAGLRKQGIEDPQVVAGHRQRLEHLIRVIEANERERLLSLVAEQEKKSSRAAATSDNAAALGGVQRREPSFDATPPSQDLNVRKSPEPNEVEPEVRVDAAAEKRSPAEPSVKPPKTVSASEKTERSEPRLATDDHFDVVADENAGAYDLTNAGRRDENLAFKPEPIVVHKKRRGFFARLMIIFTLLAFAILGAAWVYSSGVLIGAEQRDQSVPNPPPVIEEEDFDGTEGSAIDENLQPVTQQLSGSFSADWLEVFNAEKNLGSLKAGSSVSTEAVQLPSGRALRVSSNSASTSGDLVFDVPVDLMRQVTGRAATIAITLQSSSDVPTQVAVDCDFKSLGNCSRHRFTAMPERSDMLIDARFTDTIVANAAGKITLNADVIGNGGAVNIYSIRILPST